MENNSSHLLLALTTLVLLLLVAVADGRPVRRNPEVSDGIDYSNSSSSSLLLMGQREMSVESSLEGEAVCLQLYGFLPCSNSVLGHLFLIVVYEFLLFHGESYVAAGSEQIFKILGPGFFGASVFHILGALPESLILLASGLVTTTESAQEYVLTGVGLLAGSSILLLTLLWGTCVILGSTDFSSGMESVPLISSVNSSLRPLSFKKLLSSLKGCGIITDLETSYTARIMVLSVIPFVIIQLVKLFPLSSQKRVFILSTLVLSVILLLLYFIYQIFEPWIQKRRLEYVKHEQLVLRILQHVQKRALQRLLTENGAPNVQAIRRLFEEIDQDADDRISPSELKELLLEIKFKHMHLSKEEAVEEVVREFDLDGDQAISKEEFVNGFIKWLEEAKGLLDKQSYSKKSFQDLFQVFQPFVQKKKEERELKKHLIEEILRHIQNKSVESLLTENGTPDLPIIRRLFEEIDHDGDNLISQSELKELIVGIKFGKIPFDVDQAVATVIEVFDTSGDHVIDEGEFVAGLTRWLENTVVSDTIETPKSQETQDDFYQKTWMETDKLVDQEEAQGNNKMWIWAKAIGLLLLGIVILSVLAEPLIYSVQNFSKAANLPSFFISFILVPWATNARGSNSAIEAARRKKPRTTSLTFSEIYGGVFMNNVLGLCVLLSLIYARDLTWEFSAEVLVVFIVCAMIGLVASFRSTFPALTSIVAYTLYPLSLLCVYLLEDILNYT